MSKLTKTVVYPFKDQQSALFQKTTSSQTPIHKSLSFHKSQWGKAHSQQAPLNSISIGRKEGRHQPGINTIAWATSGGVQRCAWRSGRINNHLLVSLEWPLPCPVLNNIVFFHLLDYQWAHPHSNNTLATTVHWVDREGNSLLFRPPPAPSRDNMYEEGGKELFNTCD